MPLADAIIEFAAAARADRAANPGAGGDGAGLELLLAPRFQALAEAVLPEVTAAPPNVLPEYRRRGVGRPDIALAHPGAPARAFVELKQPDLALDPARFSGHNKDQFERFRELPVWALCNFVSIQLYRRGEPGARADILPASALDPDTNPAAAARSIRALDHSGFEAILRTLATAQPVPPADAREAARVLAHAARLTRSTIAAQCREGLDEVVSQVQADFNETLFARAEAGGYDPGDADALFSSAFAQTLVFGLLLAREAGEGEIDHRAYERLADANQPLLRGTLRALTLDEVRAALGAAFDVALDAVNSIDPSVLAPNGDRDPVLYLYEDFLRVFDPEAVEKHGVYYTPPEIVRLIVAEVDRVLRENLGAEGLLDPGVHLLDPACGTGTFLIAAANAAAGRAAEAYGEGAVAAEIEAFARRMHGFELLVGPYTVAHYRMSRTVAGHGGAVARLPIFLTDTLAPPAGEEGVEPHLAFLSAPMVAEREAADEVKRTAPVLVVMGNPPYKRLGAGEVERLVGADMDARWEDLKLPVKQAGMGLSLNAFPDLYVAFYRWAIWRLFEAEGALGRGVLAFITNRGFLAGSGFGGLRKMLRERFDRIRIVDFRGDRRGARPATVARDENVFAIETGVCVLVAEAAGQAEPGREAVVEYADVWREGAFDRAGKLDLARAAATDPGRLRYLPIEGAGMDRFTPTGFAGTGWPAIDEAFLFRSNGIVTYRDAFSYAVTREELRDRITRWHTLGAAAAAEEFKETAGRKAGPARATVFDEAAIRRVSYRPFDIRHLYNRPEFIDRPRTDLQRAWGAENVALFALGDGTGAGPAVWCHALVPDQHAFSARGGWVFPLWSRSGEGGGHYLHPGLLRALSGVLEFAIAPLEMFDAVLALLSASSYTTRFAHDLEDGFPRIPFPADPAVFRAAAALGSRIRAVQTFAEPPAERFRRARLVGRASAARLRVPAPGRAFAADGEAGAIALLPDGSLRAAGVSRRAWEFAIGGYPVLRRWLGARKGEALDAPLQRALLDTIARIEEILSLFDEADAILEAAAENSLGRGQIGLLAPEGAARNGNGEGR